MVTIQEVLPFDAVAFADWHRALADGQYHGRVAAIVSTLKELTDSLAVPSKEKRRIAVAATAADRCVGAMLVELPLVDDLDTLSVEISVPPAERRQGIGGSLWDWATQLAADSGRSIVHAEVHLPAGATLESWPGARFALARGFTSVHLEDHLVADLPFDPARLAQLDARHDASSGYHVEHWVGRCPNEYLQAWADLQTAMSADLPTGELTRDTVVYTIERIQAQQARLEKNWLALNALALTDAGEPVGYSIIYLPHTQPQHALQDDTLVLRAHRGHDLGALLKVTNLHALERLPTTATTDRRWLHTYTARDNAAMQRVNARFGFRAIEELHELELSR